MASGAWSVQEASGPGPFVTHATLTDPSGAEVRWTSRRHRKGLGLSSPGREGGPSAGWARPSRSSVWMGALFAVGSLCFAVGSLPAYSDRMSVGVVAATFFVGSLFFTSAAYLQFHETINASAGPGEASGEPRGFRRLMAWAPHRLDWWISTVQLVGTVAFNVSTLAATGTDLSVARERRWIWAPDAFGSACFLLACWGALVEAGAGGHRAARRTLGWWISVVNLVGAVAFGISAVVARYVVPSGEIANLPLVNLATFAGAVCFLVGAVLLPVESARETT